MGGGFETVALMSAKHLRVLRSGRGRDGRCPQEDVVGDWLRTRLSEDVGFTLAKGLVLGRRTPPWVLSCSVPCFPVTDTKT